MAFFERDVKKQKVLNENYKKDASAKQSKKQTGNKTNKAKTEETKKVQELVNTYKQGIKDQHNGKKKIKRNDTSFDSGYAAISMFEKDIFNYIRLCLRAISSRLDLLIRTRGILQKEGVFDFV